MTDISIYDISGRKVESLLGKTLVSGNHFIKYDASDLPSGMYLYSIVVSWDEWRIAFFINQKNGTNEIIGLVIIKKKLAVLHGKEIITLKLKLIYIGLFIQIVFSETYKDRIRIYIDNSVKNFKIDDSGTLSNNDELNNLFLITR